MLWYPGACTQGGKDGLVVAVEPQAADSWVGVFAPDPLRPERGLTRVACLPGGESVAVLSGGAAYAVSAKDPHTWGWITRDPVAECIPVRQAGILVFVDNTAVVAYDAQGVAWRSGRLVWDGLHVVAIGSGEMLMEGGDAQSGREVRFRIDLRSGDSVGAPYPRDPTR